MEYAAELNGYMVAIQLMSVEVKVIEMITNGIISMMIPEELTQLNQDLEEINEGRLEQSVRAS